jgi:hypothetical protein
MPTECTFKQVKLQKSFKTNGNRKITTKVIGSNKKACDFSSGDRSPLEYKNKRTG